MLATAIVLAIIAALIDHFFPMKDPWRKIVIVGVIILFVVGVIALIFPGLIPVVVTRWP